jgi:aminoglycoside phosphotransferase (APT) family kinase protein
VPFYVMERIPGVILRRRLPSGLVIEPPTARRLSEAFIDQLAALHAVDYHAAGLGDLGKPEGYVQRQVSGWTRRYQDARTDEIADVEWIAAWLAGRIPPETGATLVHGDFKYDNLVLDAADLTRVIGILDWEMATLGDPLVDLGVALGYWVEASDNQIMRQFAFGPTDLPGMLTRRELAERYAARTGRSLDNIVFYYCFALFKTAVVAQQIYYRYRQGLTKDPRFAMLGEAVKILAHTAVASAESSRI